MGSEMKVAETVLARLRRWWHLLTVGMWRGECAVSIRNPEGRLTVLGSGTPVAPGCFQSFRIWWSAK